MIIYGYRSKLMASQFITEACPKCGASQQVQMYVLQRYAHIFWIPLFPIGKTGVAQCDTCKATYKKSQMDTGLKMAYSNMKSQVRPRWWMFSGLIIIALLLLSLTRNSMKNEAKSKQRIEHPSIGDCYKIKTENGNFSLMRVERVEDDTVYVSYCEYESTSPMKLYKLTETAFGEISDSFSKYQIQQQYQSGKISGVVRRNE